MEKHLPLAAQKASHNDEDDEEQAHFHQVCRSYQQYATFHQTVWQGVNHRVHRLQSGSLLDGNGDTHHNGTSGHAGPTVSSILPAQLTSGTVENQTMNKEFCSATIRNQFFLDSVLRYSGISSSQEVLRETQQNLLRIDWVTEDQMSKVDSVLKSVARDWSAEGRYERGVVYDRMLNALERYLPLDGNAAPKRVAVPGSGLGRLAWEIHAKGYTVQGSDFSLPMLLASDFILNGCAIHDDSAENGSGGASGHRQFNISPWMAETKNVTSFENRIRSVIVPDVDPSSIQDLCHGDGEPPQFSMLAGEFLALYSHFLPENRNCNHDHTHKSEKFHSIACSFFLDTAPSLPEYLITIYHMLEDRGILLHFGPLMYHWSGHGALIPKDLSGNTSIDDVNRRHKNRNAYLDPRYLSSVDFTWEEVRQMIINTGFEVLEEETNIPALYTSNPNSMMEVSYRCVFLVARKRSR